MKTNAKPRIAFFGTPELAVFVLEELSKAGLAPDLVITAPDKPKGRGLVLTSPPVKIWAQKSNIPILQPEKLDSKFISTLYTLYPTPYRSSTSFGSFASLRLQNSSKGFSALPDVAPEPYTLFIVAAYGKIIPKEILELPTHGTLNVHPSLLPEFRGSSPIESAILSGKEKTGVSIMVLDEKMDHGPIVAQKEFFLNDTSGKNELSEKLFRLGGQMLAEIIPKWIAGEIKAIPQEHGQATYTKKISKKDGLIDLYDGPILNYRKIRAYEGWPGTYFFSDKNGKKIRVVIKNAELKDGALVIKKVVLEGKKEMDYEAFAKPTSL